MTFLTDLTQAFRENASADNAGPMEAYMKHHFQFYGIKAPLRKQITKQIGSQHKTEVKNNAREIGLTLLQQQQREFHYAAMEILEKELRGKFVKKDIELIEKTLITDSWWDTVDFLAKYLLGNYLLQFPEETETVVARFSDSENMWLNRSAILFQLGYKNKTDVALLFALCEKHSGSGEFFIQKAIGWALREYAKTDPKAVIKFVLDTTLKPLSKREALKNL
ncbi:DNA alkylation repair protein [Flavobacterium sp. CAU 1735]|uniref:DNA alkylation repair protein n=1 Tax=Flavobacterium sp. CAU 1735 TaxID=3140361 RepID=UPI0032601334